MGRGRKRRQRNKPARRKQQQSSRLYEVPDARRISLALRPLDVELAAAHDGFLRGGIEVRVVTSFVVIRPDGTAVMVARQLWKQNATNNDVPQTLTLDAPPVEQRFSVPYGSSVAVILAAYEEDGGRDVEQAYADIEHADALTVWRESDDVPMTLERMVEHSFHSGDVYPVELALNGRAFSDGTSDKWVGASVVRFRFEKKPPRFRRELRFALIAPDRKNNWTVRARFEYQ